MPDAPESVSEAAHALRGVVGSLRRRLLAVSGTDQLTPAQATALTRIVRGDAAAGAELAHAEGISPQAAAVTIAALEKAGLIARSADPEDGRRHLIAATDEGRARVQGARDAREAWLEEGLAEDFSEDERQLILDAMRLLERLMHR